MAISCNCMSGGSPEDDAVIRKERENKKIGQKIDKGKIFKNCHIFQLSILFSIFKKASEASYIYI